MTHTRICQECPVSLEKLSFFFIQVKIIQVLVFDNWHPLKYMYDCMGTAPVFPMIFIFWSASLHDQNLLNLVCNLLLFDVLLLHVLWMR